jgi:hypothetical protein
VPLPPIMLAIKQLIGNQKTVNVGVARPGEIPL